MTEVNRDITLQVGEAEFTFKLNPQEITKYFNAMTQTNKVAPAHNLLMRTIDQEQKASLKPLLENPLMTMNLAGELLQEYGPDVEVTVKKSSSTLSA